MKKLIVVAGFLGVMLLVFGVVGTVFAQSGSGFGGVLAAQETPEPEEDVPFAPGFCGAHEDFDGDYECGDYDGWGGMHHGYDSSMHTDMIEVLADATGLTVDEINERIAAGESMFQIVETEGLEIANLAEQFSQSHIDRMQQAVEDGLLTQDQADWMNERMGGYWNSDADDESYVPGFFEHGRGRGCGGMKGWYQQPSE